MQLRTTLIFKTIENSPLLVIVHGLLVLVVELLDRTVFVANGRIGRK